MLFVDIEKSLGDFTLRVCFEAKDTVLSLLGGSGSGKSMTLKCIAGIEKPDKGRIILNDRVLFDSEEGINLSPQKRKVGYLFQQYALFPNMSVRQNIDAALNHLPRKERAAQTDRILKEYQIKELENKRPDELSGGEKQRTALARIMANNPEVILLDEPFSALDSYLKWQLLLEMKNVIAKTDKDVIFVTHNVDEVIALSDTICVLDNGKSASVKNVEDAIKNPKTVSEAKLFGCKNFSKTEAVISKDASLDESVISCTDWKSKLAVKSVGGQNDNISFAGVFSGDIELKSSECDNAILCSVLQIVKTESGDNVILKINDADACLCALLPVERKVAINDCVWAYIKPEKLMLLEE